ncbi:MAG: hypothetical protein CVT49_15945 [candidate division Zixibacteria bacterium HGW-Zixibacteria-1]|nr:MAG: hypothetical protein CVT49_15945 [candidate division Zixibacteria bacterium HGW-Zixibacteria-1]
MNDESKIDINKLLIKPVYIGLFMNILVPAILLGIVYYIDKNGGQGRGLTSDTYNIMFWALCVVAISEGAMAFILRQKFFFSPMAVSKETLEDDLVRGFMNASIICYAFTSAIAIYGLILFFMGGTFETMVLFVLISMIAYQFIRPRYGFAKKVIEAQEKFVQEGHFYQPKK